MVVARTLTFRTECAIGVVTDKTAAFIKKNAEAAAKEQSQSSSQHSKVVLQKHRWVPVKLLDRSEECIAVNMYHILRQVSSEL